MPHITISTIPTGDTLELQRGDTLTVTATRLGDISGRDKLWFTVKDDTADADILAQIQIEETAGLLYIAGAAATTPANGSITVTDAVRGDLTVVLAAVEAAKLNVMGRWYYDIQDLEGVVITTRLRGRTIITGDVGRATS